MIVVTVFDKDNFERFNKRESLKRRTIESDTCTPYTESYKLLFDILGIESETVLWGLSKCRIETHKDLPFYGIDDTKLYYVVCDVSDDCFPHDYYDWSDHLFFKYMDKNETRSDLSLSFIKEYKEKGEECSHIEQVLYTYNMITNVLDDGVLLKPEDYMNLITKYMKQEDV